MTTFRTPASRAAMRTFKVPVTFASCVANGFFTERWTLGRAAWWKIPSASWKRSWRRGASLMSPRTKVTAPLSIRPWMFSIRPVERLSMIVTSWSCESAPARFEPMNPAPPVMMYFMVGVLRMNVRKLIFYFAAIV